MGSTVFTDSRRQLTLDLDGDLAQRFRNLRECVAQGVYRKGLTYVAGQLNMSPGNLSSELGDESQRKFGVDELEEYIAKTGDKQPIYYLVARFLGDEAASRDAALTEVQRLLQELPAKIAAAGLQPPPKGRGR